MIDSSSNRIVSAPTIHPKKWPISLRRSLAWRADPQSRAVVHATGLPITLRLTEGQAHDGRNAEDMLDTLGAELTLLADRPSSLKWPTCGAATADVQPVNRGIGLDKWTGFNFLDAKLGYCSSCSPRTTWRRRPPPPTPMRPVETTVAVNDARRLRMADKIAAVTGGGFPARRSRSSALPSSPTPTTCATPPR